MESARRFGGALAAVVLAWSASADPPATSPGSAPQAAEPFLEVVLDRLPPGVRPLRDRAHVETERATYGDRVVERVDRSGAPGEDFLEVEFTVDPRLEARIRAILTERQVALGHVIVMDPRSGELFAYVSTAPERFPATRVYPAASLMKVVTAAGVLQHAPDVATRTCRTLGSPWVLDEGALGGGGHAEASGQPVAPTAPVSAGPMLDEPVAPALARAWLGSFRSALAISNNQCFGRYAIRDLGAERLLAEIARTGVISAPAPQHPAGAVDRPEAPLALAELGSGLSGSWFAPLAAARLAALLVDGVLVSPRWIAEVRDAQGIAVGAQRGEAPQRVWEPSLARELRELMQSVTETGTARRAFHAENGTPRLGPVGVAGKTGTLRGEAPEGLYQWFIGVAPTDAPRIAIASVVVHPEGGSAASASEVAAASLEAIFCTGPSGCAAHRADTLYARSRGRDAQVARSLREAVARAREADPALDSPLRPLDDHALRLPRRLLRQKTSGEARLRVEVDPDGGVVDVAVESSDLPPHFDAYLVEMVREWRFTPPRRRGRPVGATALLPIPIHVE